MEFLTMTFQTQEKDPLYQQLYRYLVREISSGNLREGERLPSKRSLALQLKISQNTVENAYGMLVTEGYVRAVPKSGYYVQRLETPSFPSVELPKVPPVSPPPSYRYDFGTSAVDTAGFPYATWAKLTKSVVYNSPELLNHGHPQGDLCLREAIAKYLHGYRGVNCTPDQIVVGAGIEYLTALIAQLLDRDLVFALENPGYGRSFHILKNSGREIRFIGLDQDGMIPEELEERGGDIAYLTPSHQFPMGAVMPIGRRLRLLAWAGEKAGRYIIEDDYDSEFRYAGRPIPSLQGIDRGGKVIYIGTFSKSIAPSIRAAYLVLPPVLLEKFRRDFSFYSSTVSRFEQHTLAYFLEEGHFGRHLNRLRTLYRQREELLVSLLRSTKIPLRIFGGKAGLHLLVQVKNGMTERELVRRAEGHGIRLTGLSEYCLSPVPDLPESTVVLGYGGLGGEKLREAVKLLEASWDN